jgi:very-short-patch-repair endonuclease
MIIVEYEGDQHRTEWRQWNTDIDRNEEFTAAGWIVIRVTGKAMRRPREIARRVYDALRQPGYTGPPPRFDEDWIRLFEQ